MLNKHRPNGDIMLRTKRFIPAIFLALICALALMPATAFAVEPEARIGDITYATLQEALDAARDGDTVTVLKDIELPEDTRLSVAPVTPISFTLDLNQKTISKLNYDVNSEHMLGVDKPVKLTITNGTLVAGWDGVMPEDDAETATAIAVTCSEAPSVDLTVSNVKIFASNVAVANDVSDSPNPNRITLRDVDIKSLEYGVYSYDSPADIIFESGSIVGDADGCFYLYGCNLTVNGGDFRSSDYAVGYFSNNGYDPATGNYDKGCNVTINGGNFVCSSSDYPVLDIYGSEVTINGGRFANTVGDTNESAVNVEGESKVMLNGGTFESAGGCFDIEEGDAWSEPSEVILGDNLRSIYSDGTDVDWRNTTYTQIVPKIATINAAPELEVAGKTIQVGEDLDLRSLIVSATDAEDGDLTAKVELADDGGFDNSKPGEYTITFRVADKDGASISKSVVVKVVAPAPATPGGTAAPAAPGDNKPAGLPQTGDTVPSAPVVLAVAGAAAIAVATFELKKTR